jgi:hypothetical protein
VKERIYSVLKGIGKAFVGANLLISIIAYINYPDFFYTWILFKPEFLRLTIPLSAALYLQFKYLRQFFDDRENDIIDEFDEVKPDLGN